MVVQKKGLYVGPYFRLPPTPLHQASDHIHHLQELNPVVVGLLGCVCVCDITYPPLSHAVRCLVVRMKGPSGQLHISL